VRVRIGAVEEHRLDGVGRRVVVLRRSGARPHGLAVVRKKVREAAAQRASDADDEDQIGGAWERAELGSWRCVNLQHIRARWRKQVRTPR